MRKTCLDMVYELACENDQVLFIGSDLGTNTLQTFKEAFPERFFMEGVAEANLIGMAAGLASNGWIPYVNTLASFISRRCFEQVAIDIGHARLKVRLIGNGGGLVYGPLGHTHLATDDIALFRTIPGMTIVAPADADEMRRLMPQTLAVDGPLYIRLARGHDPIVTTDEQPFVIGKAIPVADGTDGLLLTTGIGLRIAKEAREHLAAQGVHCGIVHVPTIKPLDRQTILERVRAVPAVITIEEHTIVGGFGSAVAETLAEADLVGQLRFRRIGINDVYPDDYGRQADVLTHCGIDAESVCKCLLGLLKD